MGGGGGGGGAGFSGMGIVEQANGWPMLKPRSLGSRVNSRFDF